MVRAWYGLAALVCLGLALAAPVAMPQDNPVQPAPANDAKDAKTLTTDDAGDAEAAKQDDSVIIDYADDLQSESNTGPHHLRGNVKVRARGVQLLCDAADYDENSNSMKASGNLRIVDKESIITGDLLDADFDRELMVITGNVQVVAQRKPDSQKPKESAGTGEGVSRDKGPRKSALAPPDGSNKAATAPEGNDPAKAPGKGKPLPAKEARYRRTVITCERVEYYYADDQKRMIATPRVKAVQEERTVFADQALYEDLARLVTLTGNVLIQGQDGDEMRCQKAVVHVDDEWVKAEKVSGVTLRKSGGQKPRSPAPKPEAGGEPPPAPPPTAASGAGE
jgi:lipopolysaccharide assembly outer membrane protein LptD (OstA)